MTVTTPTGTQNTARAGIKREIAIIPAWAIAGAAVVFILVPALFFGFVWRGQNEAPRLFTLLVISFFPGTFLAMLVLMVGYVNRDAGRRGMSRTMWTLLVIFVPNAIGFIIYFLLRNPIRTACPKCGTGVELRQNYCPGCGYSFHPSCPQCRSAVRPGDTFCANCGVKLQL
jgi:hypothetical protein